jgi:hypothetical protein
MAAEDSDTDRLWNALIFNAALSGDFAMIKKAYGYVPDQFRMSSEARAIHALCYHLPLTLNWIDLMLKLVPSMLNADNTVLHLCHRLARVSSAEEAQDVATVVAYAYPLTLNSHHPENLIHVRIFSGLGSVISCSETPKICCCFPPCVADRAGVHGQEQIFSDRFSHFDTPHDLLSSCSVSFCVQSSASLLQRDTPGVGRQGSRA